MKFDKLNDVKIVNWIMRFFIAAIMVGILSSCKAEEETPLKSPSTLPVPAEFTKGENSFNLFCAKCHGKTGVGTKEGPPLVHKIYEPNHHGDISFHFAAQKGVRAHHWKFGDMPKVEEITEGEVNEVIGYVRWLQREAGIY